MRGANQRVCVQLQQLLLYAQVTVQLDPTAGGTRKDTACPSVVFNHAALTGVPLQATLTVQPCPAHGSSRVQLVPPVRDALLVDEMRTGETTPPD